MRLTVMSDYSLRVLMYVAQQPDRLCTIAEIAAAYSISEAHLMKIIHQLGLAGFVATVRGKGGGLKLARPPHEIVVGDVVRATESDFALVECFATGQQCVLTGQCKLTGILEGALDSFLSHLDGYTLADLLPAPRDAGAPVRIHRRRSATT